MKNKLFVFMLLTISLFSLGNSVKADTIYNKIREFSVSSTTDGNLGFTRTFKTKSDGYVVGTDNAIVYIDKNGKEVWRKDLGLSSKRSISLYDMVVNKDSVVYTTCSASINLEDGIPGTLNASTNNGTYNSQQSGKLSNNCTTQKLKISNGSVEDTNTSAGGNGIETIGDSYYIFNGSDLAKLNSNLQISKTADINTSDEDDSEILDMTTYGDNLYVLTSDDIKVYDSNLNNIRNITPSIDDSYNPSETGTGIISSMIRGFIYDGSKFFYTNGMVARTDVSGKVEILLPYKYSSRDTMFISGIRVNKYFVVGNIKTPSSSSSPRPYSKVDIYDSNINIAQSINLSDNNHSNFVLNISPSNYGFIVKWIDVDTRTLYVTEYGKKFNIKTNIKGQGSVDVDSIAFAGDKISFRVMARDGYVVSKIGITTSSGKKVVFNEDNIEQDSNGLITLNNGNFIMPGDDITIDVQFRKAFFSNPETSRSVLIIGFIIVISFGVFILTNKKKKEIN